MKTVWIGGAWPYANGDLHLGHVAGLLPGDIIARYYRNSGNRVCYVSGTDCHGTPIVLKAKANKTTAVNIAEHYHKRFVKDFTFLNFSYDYYGKTNAEHHKDEVKNIFTALVEQGDISEVQQEQYYCRSCKLHLAERLLVGECPYCLGQTRSGQCEHCNRFIEGDELSELKCCLCHSEPIKREVDQASLQLKNYEALLKESVAKASTWRKNAKVLTKRYLDEGIKNKVITRSLDWGVDVPLVGYESQRVYVWFDAVIGYLSATKKWANESNVDWKDFLYNSDELYFVHGKDNIPFHTLVYPVVQQYDPALKSVNNIVSNEHLTYGGRKISTSKGRAPWVKNYTGFDADSIRLFLTINAPEVHDADFSDHEFKRKHDHYLVDVLGNYYHRTFRFVERFFDGKCMIGNLREETKALFQATFGDVGKSIERGNLKEAIYKAFELVKWSNKYYDQLAPWVTRKSDIERCKEDLNELVSIAVALSRLLEPFLPNQALYIASTLGVDTKVFSILDASVDVRLSNVKALYTRLIK